MDVSCVEENSLWLFAVLWDIDVLKLTSNILFWINVVAFFPSFSFLIFTGDMVFNSCYPVNSAVRANFEFIKKLGVEKWCFHDRDIAPEGSTLEVRIQLLTFSDFPL